MIMKIDILALQEKELLICLLRCQRLIKSLNYNTTFNQYVHKIYSRNDIIKYVPFSALFINVRTLPFTRGNQIRAYREC